MIHGDFEKLLGISNPWTSVEEKQEARVKGIVLLSIFMALAFVTLSSIIMTIKTNPGGIPDDKEWDMHSDSNMESESDSECSRDNIDKTGRKSKE